MAQTLARTLAHRPHHRRVDARLRPAPAAARRRAQRRPDRARRPRLRAARLLRLRHRHADDRRPRRRRPALQPLPRHALCSPTRACLLTGRNHHAVGMGFLTDIPIGVPGLQRPHPESRRRPLPRLLRDAGYSTLRGRQVAPRAALGADRRRARSTAGRSASASSATTASSAATPTSGRPTWCATTASSSRRARPSEGYHLTEDLADQRHPHRSSDQQQATPGQAVLPLLRARRDARAAPGAARSGSSRYRGRFDDGWDAWRDARLRAPARARHRARRARRCTERPRVDRGVGDAAAPTQRRLYARMMEVFAGFLAHTDAQIGRVLALPRRARRARRHARAAALRQRRERRGRPASARSTSTASPTTCVDDLDEHARAHRRARRPRAYNHYPWGWAWAGNTPFRLWKRYTWLGGVRTPLIVHWPRGIAARGEVRDAVLPRRRPHADDPRRGRASRRPTCVDGVDAAAARRRVARCRRSPTRRRPRRARTQYFEMLGSRAIYHDGWKATTDHVGRSSASSASACSRAATTSTHDHWALFDLDRRLRRGARRRAPSIPSALRALIELLVGRGRAQPGAPARRRASSAASVAIEPSPWGPRWRAGAAGPAAARSPRTRCRRWAAASACVAEVDVPTRGADGRRSCALGDWSNGWALLPARRPAGVAFNLLGDVVRCAGDAAARRRARTRSASSTDVGAAAAGRSRCASTATVRRARAAAARPAVPLADRRRRPARRPRPRLPGVRRLPAAVRVHRHDRPRRDRVAALLPRECRRRSRRRCTASERAHRPGNG